MRPREVQVTLMCRRITCNADVKAKVPEPIIPSRIYAQVFVIQQCAFEIIAARAAEAAPT